MGHWMGNASLHDREAPATPARPPSPPAFGPAVRPWDATHPSGTMLPGREKPGVRSFAHSLS